MSNVRMRHGLFFQKMGMTRVFENNVFVPVTVLTFLRTRILETKNDRAKILVEGNFAKVRKPQKVELDKKYSITDAKKIMIREVPLYRNDGIVINQDCNLSDIINVGEYVDVSGISKGHGFTGVMKRWNFHGGRESHGASLSHRSMGSTGMRQDPGKVSKGKKMPGHYGCDNTTQQNLKVVRIIPEHNILLVSGSIPGAKKSTVLVKRAVKK
jgi:large subunit ribosomal protein L3